jgi:multisubunit Na+/H+ antiporter MnhG subunit
LSLFRDDVFVPWWAPTVVWIGEAIEFVLGRVLHIADFFAKVMMAAFLIPALKPVAGHMIAGLEVVAIFVTLFWRGIF